MDHWLGGFRKSAFTVIESCLVIGATAGSVGSDKVTVKEKVPCEVVLPEMIPVALSSVNPAGRAPAVIFQRYGWMPPVPVSCVVYGLPRIPADRLVVVIASGGEAPW